MDIPIYIVVLSFLVVCVVNGSRKKGYGIDLLAYKCDDLDALDNIVWWYDWGPSFKSIQDESRCTIDDKYLDPFVPMIWGYHEDWDSDIYTVDQRHEFVLGFNEPNHFLQSDLTPQQAADSWYIVEQAAKGKQLVSPAAAKCGNPASCHNDTMAWFDEFFRIICADQPTNPCRVDYLATHMYKCKAQQTMRLLQELYDKYQLKIWLTEFACPNEGSADKQLEYMKAMLDELEKKDFIYRYAWYVHRRDEPDSFIGESANLFETGSSTLTALGHYYNDYTYNTGEPAPAGVCRRRTTRK